MGSETSRRSENFRKPKQINNSHQVMTQPVSQPILQTLPETTIQAPSMAWDNTLKTKCMIEGFRDSNKLSEAHFFRKLPKELLFVIFDNCDPVTAVCLSLTCKTFYDVYKYTKPALVPLTSPVPAPRYLKPKSIPVDPSVYSNQAWGYRIQFCQQPEPIQTNSSHTQPDAQLYELVRGFMGPKYRWPKWNESKIYQLPDWDLPDNWLPEFPRFLNKDVYGAEERDDNYKEIALIGRWHDYNHSCTCRYRLVSPRSRQHRARCHKTLPNPYNMGDAWYSEAKKVIWADRDSHDHEWSTAPLSFHGFKESLTFTSREWYCWKTAAIFKSENLLGDLGNEFMDYKAKQSTSLWLTVKVARFLYRSWLSARKICESGGLILLPAGLWLYSKMGLDHENDTYQDMLRLHRANKDGSLRDGTFLRAKTFVFLD